MSLSITKLQQKLKRQELKLARMKSRLNEERERDTRQKYRLGVLIFQLEWENLDDNIVEKKLSNAQNLLTQTERIMQYQTLGESEFKRREDQQKKISTLSTKGLSEQERLALNHRVIELGGSMIKYRMDQFSRNAVLGVLMSVTD